MRPSDKRHRARTRSAILDWLVFDERQAAWIVIAIGGVLFYAMMSAG